MLYYMIALMITVDLLVFIMTLRETHSPTKALITTLIFLKIMATLYALAGIDTVWRILVFKKIGVRVNLTAMTMLIILTLPVTTALFWNREKIEKMLG